MLKAMGEHILVISYHFFYTAQYITPYISVTTALIAKKYLHGCTIFAHLDILCRRPLVVQFNHIRLTFPNWQHHYVENHCFDNKNLYL